MSAKTIRNAFFNGERPLFGLQDAELINTTFGEGESPLKESSDLKLDQVIFQWKYPLWYARNIDVQNSIFETMSRSGIWYTKNIALTNCTLQAPKLFRRCQGVTLSHVQFADAKETLWTCRDVTMKNCTVTGDYFGKDSQNVVLDHVRIVGNYAFDGGSHIEAHNCHFVSKYCFWNCEDVTLYDCFLDGEYLAWNTKRLRLVNCTIVSDQGLNYIDDLTLENCRLNETDLAFEYCSNVSAQINGRVDSVKNPLSGKICADEIGELILDPEKTDPEQVEIVCPKIVSRRTKSDQNQHAKE